MRIGQQSSQRSSWPLRFTKPCRKHADSNQQSGCTEQFPPELHSHADQLAIKRQAPHLVRQSPK
jgi:hypothetical protein